MFFSFKVLSLVWRQFGIRQKEWALRRQSRDADLRSYPQSSTVANRDIKCLSQRHNSDMPRVGIQLRNLTAITWRSNKVILVQLTTWCYWCRLLYKQNADKNAHDILNFEKFY